MADNDFAGKYPDRKTVNDFHHNSDLDASDVAQHHTLGTTSVQAAKGSHDHRDGNGKPLLEDVSFTGSRTTNVNLILNQLCNALALLGASNNTSA